ncbi:ferrichrome-iron receptor [Psychrobacter sp. JCM 18901]|nr:ferrichrome-iron receptor [Psychrobacter sp. JCM 18901]
MLNDWVDLAASYSYTDAEITEDEFNPDVVGNTPAQTAKHKATLWADYYATDKLTLNAGVRYEDGMQIDKQNSDELPSVTLVDVGGSYQINLCWRWVLVSTICLIRPMSVLVTTSITAGWDLNVKYQSA